MRNTELSKTPVLDIKNLSLGFRHYDTGLRQRDLHVIWDLHLAIGPGEIVAVVGSSGSGKSLLAHALLGILPDNAFLSGTLRYRGQEMTSKRLQRLRGRDMMLIPQSVSSLDPLMTVGDQVRTAIPGKRSRHQRETILEQALTRFSLDPSVQKLYPFQLSGGMARRVLICCAVVSGAQFLVADEPTPGLHSETVHRTLDCLRTFADEGRSVMLITHDIDLSMSIADRIAVFYAGTVVEVANIHEFRGNGNGLRHPYSKALFHALPQNSFAAIEGTQPSHYDTKQHCPFAARCEFCSGTCRHTPIEMRPLRNGHVRCIHAH